jgi:FAD-dependent urate hydroxylase
MSLSVAVVGAGVAGLACAALLQRAGHRVTVFERRSSIGSLGAGVMLWPDACAVLDQIGGLLTALTVAGQPTAMTRQSPDGEPLEAMDFTALSGNSDYPLLSILRADLMDILADACAGVDIHFGTIVDEQRLATLQQAYDLVLGCDGRMQSICRQFLGQASAPLYSGFVNVIGVSQHVGEPTDRVFDIWQPDLRFGVVPVRKNRCYWAAAWCEPEGNSRKVSVAELQQRFQHWLVQSVLRGAEDTSVRTVAVYDLDPISVWHEHNVLLVGDAAHAPLPTSGQGACLALEDASTLANILADSSSLPQAMTEYTQRRQRRTAAVQQLGRRMADQLFPGRIG